MRNGRQPHDNFVGFFGLACLSLGVVQSPTISALALGYRPELHPPTFAA